jgi:hypothetical protein
LSFRFSATKYSSKKCHFVSYIKLVLSTVLFNISSTNSFPASIADLSESILDSSSSFLVNSNLNMISLTSTSACYSTLPFSSSLTTGIPFLVIPSISILCFLACKAPSGITLNLPPSSNFSTNSSSNVIIGSSSKVIFSSGSLVPFLPNTIEPSAQPP